MRTIVWLGIYSFIAVLEKHWGLYDEKTAQLCIPIAVLVFVFCVVLDLVKK